MSVQHFVIRAAARAFLVAAVLLGGAAARAQSEPPILSEAFEAGFQRDAGCQQGTCNVPAGWGTWFIPRSENDLPGVNFQPQFDRATGRARSGASSQRIWTENATFTGGLYRVVNNVQVGSRVRFTIWGQVWSTNDSSPISARPSRDIRVKVGVDPLGGDNGRPSPLNGQVVWSAEQEAKDEFVQFNVEVEVRSPTIILYTSTTMKDNVRHNEVFWDDAVLEYVAPPPTATPDPATLPPQPSPTPENVASPPTATPPAAPLSPPVTYTVKPGDTLLAIALANNISLEELLRNNPGVRAEALQIGQVLTIKPGTAAAATQPEAPAASGQAPGAADAGAGAAQGDQAILATPIVGQACVQAFFDDNGNGQRDDREDLVPNIQFIVTTGGALIGSYTTTGVDEPHCFENLANQAYTVAATPPDIYVPTTPLNETLRVNGARSYFSLGLRRISDGFEDVSVEPTPEPPPTLSSDATIGLLSLSGGVLLLVGTVGFIASTILRRRRL